MGALIQKNKKTWFLEAFPYTFPTSPENADKQRESLRVGVGM